MADPASHVIPPEVAAAFYLGGVAEQAMIPGGETNITFLVTDTAGTKTILQRLSPMYDLRVAEDYEVVAAHLRAKGWEMAAARKTESGVTYLPDSSGRLWRSFGYIESAPGREREGDLQAATALGTLLGALHRDLAGLDYRPKFRHDDPHDPARQTARLKLLLPRIPDPADRELAAKMIALSSRDKIDNRPEQLIHADPRVGNTLFRAGKPFTFIDWDGYKRANVLADVGDMLQSTAGEVLTKGAGRCSAEQLYPMLEAYYAEARLTAGKQAFIDRAFAAGRLIALNLGMRHLIDSVEDTYFVWDSARFKSRLEFNLFCAQRQWQVYEVLAVK